MRLVSRQMMLLFVLLLTGVLPGLPAREREKPSTASRSTAQIAPKLLIVKLRQGIAFNAIGGKTGIASFDAVLKRIGATRVLPFHQTAAMSKGIMSAAEANLARILKVSFAGADDPVLLAKEISMIPSVEYAEPWYIFPFTHTPNDPMLSQQWAVAIMKLNEAWDVTQGDTSIIIGDVDSGVDWQHPDLASSIYLNKKEWGASGELANNNKDDDGNGLVDDWHGWDLIGTGTAQAPLPDNNPMDGALGHGTNTSGCAAATANNGLGIAGAGYRVKILPIKAAGETSSGIENGYEGIKYAADMGCRVINCSWGSTGAFSQAMQDFINYANAKGALVVSSSGNNLLDNDIAPHYPSSFDHVLNVGSIESSGGASNWCTYGTSVHVYAPGSNILTTKKGGSYESPTGTSFSSPLTAGVAALVFSIHPDWTPDQVLKQIRVTSDPFSTPVQPKRFGRVNAFKAVSLNRTLSDIPGIIMRSFSVATPSGTMLTSVGQTARVEFLLENVLAPTSSNALATLEFDTPGLFSANATSFPLGAMATFASRSVIVDVTLNATPPSSEMYVPIRLKITDGAYVDYVMGRAIIYLDNAWHVNLNIGLPLFSSIHAVDESNVWATVNVTQNQVTVRDYCFRADDRGWYFANGTNFPTGQGVYCVRGIDDRTALIGTGPSNGNADIFRTLDAGQSWQRVSVSAITPFVDAIHMFDINNGIFVGDPKNGKWGLGKTTNGGGSWTAITPAVTMSGNEAGWNNSCDFVGNTGWFGTNNSKIYKTTDRGDTWVALPTPGMNSVHISFRDENVGAVAFSQQTAGGTNALAVTTNGGSSWAVLNTIATTASSSVIMEKAGTRMWVIKDSNAYVSTNLGGSWTVQLAPGGFGPFSASNAFSSPTTTTVYAAGANVFRFVSPFTGVTGVETTDDGLVRAFGVSRIYPQPAGPSGASVEFRIARTGAALLTLHDNAGRLVRTIVDAVLDAGTHASRINLSDLPAGTYHCRLTMDDAAETQSIILVR